MIIQVVNCYLGAGSGTPSADNSVSLSGSTDSSICRSIAIQVWRGVDQTTPFDIATTTATGINTGQANPPSITPSTSGAVVLGCGVGGNSASGPVFTSSDLSNFITETSAGSFPVTSGLGSINWTSGAVDPAQFGGGSTGGGASWVAATMALRPASGQTIQYVGGKTHVQNGSTGGGGPDIVLSLTDLVGGLASAPSVGDLIVVVYGLGTSGDISFGVTTAGYTEIVELFANDSIDAQMSLNWKIAE